MPRRGFQTTKFRPPSEVVLPELDPDLVDDLDLPREIHLRGVEAELCTRSFAFFVASAWPHADRGRPCRWSWHLRVLADHLQAVWEGRIERLGINIPPGFGKSLVVSVLFPAWVWLQDPSIRILAVSGIEEVLIRDSMKLHYLIDSEWYQQIFRPDWTWNAARNSKKSFANTRGGEHFVRTTKQRITGVRADLILIDDPSDASEGYADKIALDETNDWYAAALSTRGDIESKWVLIMQRLAENDLSGYIQRTEPDDWEWVVLPNEWDGEIRSTVLGEYDPRRRKGQLLFPWLMDREKTAETKRRLGRDQYYAQYQQQPAPPKGSIFHEDHFRFWSARTIPEVFDHAIVSADLAGFKSKRKRAWRDPMVLQLWGRAGEAYYLLEQYRAKDVGIQKAVEVILGWIRKVPGEVREVVVEDRAVGPELVEVLDQKLAGSGIRVVKFNPQGTSKQERAIAVQPLFEQGQVFFPHPRYHLWVRRTFLPEVLKFPRAAHDDQVDAMTQALLYLRKHGSGLTMVSLSRLAKGLAGKKVDWTKG